jgi:flagellar export protein FliJ
LKIVPGQSLDLEERQMADRWLKKLDQDHQMQQMQVDDAERAVRAQEEVVKQARIDVKALEKLREKQLEEFKQQVLYEEQVFLDDVAGQQFSRRVVEEERQIADAEEVEA